MDLTDKRILLTGGASLIGSHTAEELLRAGVASVILFDNLSFDATHPHLAPLLESDRVRLVRGDVLDATGLADAVQGVDGVFALAGYMSAGIAANPAVALDVNIRGVLNVLEACRIGGVRRLVFASSSAVYGYGAIEGSIAEDAPFRSAGVAAPAALYGASKIIGEQLCHLYRARHALDFVALRYSTVYGERQHYRSTNALYIIEAYDRVAQGLSPILYGDGSETKDFVYVGDVARANRLAMEADVSGTAFNISGGQPLTVKSLAERVIRHAGATVTPEYREAPTDGFRIATDSPFSYDHEKARALLGWTPLVSIDEGIRRLIAWRRQMSAEAPAVNPP